MEFHPRRSHDRQDTAALARTTVPLSTLPATTGLPSGLPAHKGTGKLMCRACVFSPDGRAVLVVQSAGRGASYATRWELKDGKGEAVESSPVKTGKLSVNPVPCLAMSADGKVVAAGDVEGEVTVLNATSLAKVKTMSLHGLPVTTISMMPSGASFGGFDVVTGSADKRVVLSSSGGGWVCAGSFLLLLSNTHFGRVPHQAAGRYCRSSCSYCSCCSRSCRRCTCCEVALPGTCAGRCVIWVERRAGGACAAS